MYQPRKYRSWAESKDLISYTVSEKETNLLISTCTKLERKAMRLALKYRQVIEKYILFNPEFLTSLKPLSVTYRAPAIISLMADAGRKAGVGPMAAVAGAVAQCIGLELGDYSPEVIIENGGDIYISSRTRRSVAIYAGNSVLSGKLKIQLEGHQTPCGVCTSSGTVGHSLSFGKADAVTIIAPSAALADAVATACGNLIHTPADISQGLEFARGIDGITGAVIIIGDRMGVWGDVNLQPA